MAGCQTPQPSAKQATSPDGHPYALVSLPGSERVTVHVAWESDWVTGAAEHNLSVPFIGSELLLASGAQGYPAGEVVERFPDLSAEGSLGADADHVYGVLHMDKDNMSEALEIANAHLRAPMLEERWLARVRSGFAERIGEVNSHNTNQAYAAMRWAVFGDQPLRSFLSQDSTERIQAVTRDSVVEWHRAVFSTDNVTAVIAGDLKDETAGETIDTLLAGLPVSRPESASESVEADYSPRRILLHVPTAKTSHLSFVGPLPPLSDGSRVEDDIALMALGASSNSVLHTAVREQLRASYSYGASFGAFTRSNRFLSMAGEVASDKLADAEKVVREAYSGFLKEGVKDEQLEVLKENALNTVDVALNDTGNTAFLTLAALLDEQSVDTVLALKDRISAVTEDAVKQRLDTAFPEADQLLVVAMSADKDALPGACVITRPEQAIDC